LQSREGIKMEKLIVLLKKSGGSLCVEKNTLKVTVANEIFDPSLKEDFAEKKQEIIKFL